MARHQVVTRSAGSAIGTASLIVLLVLAALIALVIWQPWNGSVRLRSTTTTATYDATSVTR